MRELETTEKAKEKVKGRERGKDPEREEKESARAEKERDQEKKQENGNDKKTRRNQQSSHKRGKTGMRKKHDAGSRSMNHQQHTDGWLADFGMEQKNGFLQLRLADPLQNRLVIASDEDHQRSFHQKDLLVESSERGVLNTPEAVQEESC